jgi:hypothetical protein
MFKSKIVGLCLICLFAFSASGCAPLVIGAAAGGGAYTYVSGWVNRSYNVDLEQAFEASVAGVSRLGVTIENQEQYLSNGSIKGTDGDSTVWVKLKSEAPLVTVISVRVGILGDEVASQRIHQAIQRKM